MRRDIRFALAVLGLCALWHASASACPGCKEALFDPQELPQRLGAARGYAASIALLLLMPVGLIGGIAALVWRARPHRSASTGERRRRN